MEKKHFFYSKLSRGPAKLIPGPGPQPSDLESMALKLNLSADLYFFS